MDFELSPDQVLLQDTVRRFLADRFPIARVRHVLDGGAPLDREVWSELAAMGALGVLVPEDLGGAGLTTVDAGVVLEEMGRACFPGPFEATAVLAAGVLADVGGGPAARWLPAIAAGEVVATVAFAPAGTLPPEPGEQSLTAALRHVPHADLADVVMAVCGEHVAVIALDGTAEISPVDSVDATRPAAHLGLSSTPATVLHAPEAAAAALDRALVAAVADGVGAASLALELAVAYARERHQFGRPIGSFQAVQHLCADMLVDLEMGRTGCYYALWACHAAEPAERRRAALLTKSWASDAFQRVGAAAIQVFGGIGFTWEHDVHLPYKRLLTLQHHLGGTGPSLDALATHVFG